MNICVDFTAVRISDIKDIIVSTAAVVTATVAIIGLYKWKAELTGKANFEASKELIKKVYKLRNEIGYCRSPGILGNEFPEGYMLFGTNSGDTEGRAWAHVYDNRWKGVREALIEYDTACLEAEALWGKEIKASEQQLMSVVRRLRAAIDATIQNYFSEGENFKSDKNFENKMRSTVSSSLDENDGFANDLDNAVSAIEEIIKPHLKRK